MHSVVKLFVLVVLGGMTAAVQAEIDAYNPKVSAGQPKKEPTKVIAIRLPIKKINTHKIDAAWLNNAVDEKIERDK